MSASFLPVRLGGSWLVLEARYVREVSKAIPWLAIGGSFNQRERAQQLWMAGRESHADKASHRQTDEVNGTKLELFDDRHCIEIQRLHIERSLALRALSLSAMIVADTAMLAS